MSETRPSTRRGFLDFSPIRGGEDNKENHLPVLTLVQFSKAPFLTFGNVKLGTSKSAILQIDNPSEDVEAEVTVEKVPSTKGFSVERNRFTVQPECSFHLLVTWTPTEEGGIRELLVFCANGVLKHQAVMLGRAEAPKKKKKSLWDSIKNKPAGEKVGVSRRKMADHPRKMAANKTFQVSRQPQYRREKPVSPLASLNKGRAVGAGSGSALPGFHLRKPGEENAIGSSQSMQTLAMSDQENVFHVQRNSSSSFPLLTEHLMNCSSLTASPDACMDKPDSRDLARMLNKTLSPIGTPERFKKIMPHIYSDSPLLAAADRGGSDADSGLSGTPMPSLKDALALIDSDLSYVNSSPQDTSSSCSFSDSLNSRSGGLAREPQAGSANTSPDSPSIGSCDQPPTSCVAKTVTSPAEVQQLDKAKLKAKKSSFVSVTVTKIKAPVEVSSLSGRKMKKSRRRLLEKTLELCDGSSCESGAGSPSLPVIELQHAGEKGRQDSLSEEFSFASQHQDPPTTATVMSPAPAAVTSSPRCSPLGPPSALDDQFPVHTVAQGKKRKSEEFARNDGKAAESERMERVKRSRVAAEKVEPSRSVQERRSVTQRQQARTAGSIRSTKTSALKAAPSNYTKQPSTKLTSRGANSLKSSQTSSVRTSRVVAVAQSKLTFVKPVQTAIPRHPMPFAAKNMFYDERWIEKQERGFTWWINYVLTPDDFKVNTEVAKVSAVSIAMGSDDNFSVPKAPTKEEMSLSTYTARRKLNRLRRSACQLFTSEAMVKAIRRLELEVEAKRLLVRKDRHLWKDIGERSKVLNWLLSYNPLWLRIGLETIYGELISLENNNDTLGLAVFILQRLLWNPDIAAEFRHAKVPHLYKDGHEEALSRFTLKKLLLLVCFMDKAKESRLIEHDPCLFCLDAEFKTSKDLLLAFSRDFLSGEGILPRHLGYLGLPVSHVQRPLDEFNFAVKNLAVDLKCGIRLVRVMELLTQDWSLSSKLRLPAISRLQKVHNVDLALQVLRRKGVDLKDERGSNIESKDIVDGHREKTLGLLWKILFAFHVEVILDTNQLIEEIGFLKRTLKTKRSLASLRAGLGPPCGSSEGRKPYEHSSTKIRLLMDWVRTVSDFYNLKVENFTVSFSDGRVLCYLIHHYHPALLPDKAVSHSTTQTVECSQRGRLELNCSASDSDTSFDSFPADTRGPDFPLLEFKELLENEKNNFRLVNNAVSYLGGVPAMINPADMSNTIPSEKVVMSYISFLCARLLDLRNETRAARVIQGAWRKYRLRKDVELYKERDAAAAKIQVLVRSFLQTCRAKRQSKAAVVIQSAWRGYAARNRLRLKREAEIRARQHAAAAVIQAQWRMHSASRSYQCLRHLTIVVQAQWRMRKTACAYQRTLLAVATIQKHWRARALARRQREQYLCLRAAALSIQSRYRRWKTLKTEKENHAARVIQTAFRKWQEAKMTQRVEAAVRIQTWFRMQSCRQQYGRILSSVVLIQACFRGHTERRRFWTLRQQHCSAVAIQRVFRGYSVRKQQQKMRCATLVIQRRFRALLARDFQRRQYLRMRGAAVALQAAYRGKITRDALKVRHQAATVIQATYRMYAAQKSFIRLREAATLLQQRYRASALAHQTRAEYIALRNAAVAVQAAWRGRAVRQQMETRQRCATRIQAFYQGYRARAKFTVQRAAITAIQRHYRAHLVRKETRAGFLRKRTACLVIQATFRGMLVRRELKRKHQAATVIQSAVRMYLSRRNFVLLQSAAIIVQSRYRALVAGREQRVEFSRLKQAATRIQAFYRGFILRRRLEKKHEAATIVQAQFRMHKARTVYLAMKCAASIIQERHRARLLGDQQRRQYTATKSAALTIQAAYRGLVVRRRVSAMHHAATVIQRRFRVVKERRRFLAIKMAVVMCQQRYRASALAKKERSEYKAKRRAVLLLQAAYRGNQARKQLHVQRCAAVTIQSHFRKHLQRVRYLELQRAARIVQTCYRACRKTRREMQLLKARRDAAVVLQAAFRGQQVRQEVALWHRAATVIQTAFRRHREQVKFQALHLSAVIIQRIFRSHMLQKRDRERFLQLRHSVVILQAAYRGRQARKELVKAHQAATVIQSAFKRRREQVKFQAIRLSAITIQRFYRSCVLQRREEERFLEVKRSAIVLQAAFRGWQTRKEVALRHQAATVIQSAFRRHRETVKFKAMRLSAVLIQRFYRSLVRQRKEREEFLKLRRSAIILQAAFRGRQIRGDIARMNKAATAIQASFKRHKQQSAFQRQRRAALVLQRKFRALKLRNADMQHYQSCKKAALALQAGCRGMMLRRRVKQMHMAASKLQRALRSRNERRQYVVLRAATIAVQRQYRATAMARDKMAKYQQMRKAALVLQAAFRGWQTRKSLAHQHQAATVIQSAFRGYSQKVKFKAIRLSAVVIQRFYRSCLLQRREQESFLKMRHSAIVLQAAFRGRMSRRAFQQQRSAAGVLQRAYRSQCQRREYLALKSSAVTIQKKYRATVQARVARAQFQELRCAVVAVQAAFRGQQVRKEAVRRHQAATVIQSAFRRHREEVKFKAMRLSAVFIQRFYRSCILQRRDQETFIKLRCAAVVLQAAFRGWRVRREGGRRSRAAVVIQAYWRSWTCRRCYLRKREAAVALQRRYRAAQQARADRRRYILMREAAIKLQTYCRARQATRQALENAKAERRLRFTSALFHHLSAIKIQRTLRAHRALENAKRQIHSVVTIQRWVRAMRQRKLYLDDRRKVVTAQRAARRWLERRHQAASVIQQAVRSFLLLRRQRKFELGLIKAQALWRGHRSRRLHDNHKVVKLRQRLRKVSAAVREEDKLCHKTSVALDYLLRYKHFSFILEALKNLEIATRLSPECCERLVDSGATDIIFTLIRCCNRSVPCMDVITFSIQILLNLSKYHKTVEAVYSVDNSVETLLDLLQRYREKAGDKVAEKGGSIFTKACFLLALLLQDRGRATDVKKLPKALDRIRSIYRLTARKHKMDAERSVIKHKMNASINGSFFIPATPRKPSAAPKFAPDWVLRKDKLKDVVDPLRAIEMVAKTLSIVL